RLLDLGRQAIEGRLGAVAAEGVLQMLAQAITQAVVRRGHGDARQASADPGLAVQGREAAAGQQGRPGQDQPEAPAAAHQPATRLTIRSGTTITLRTLRLLAAR